MHIRSIAAGLFACVLVLCAAAAQASGPSALARVDAWKGSVSEDGRVNIDLSLSQPVPWRLFTLDDPRRVVLDLRRVDWPPDLDIESGAVGGAQMGAAAGGWSRLVLSLAAPMSVAEAVLRTTDAGPATLSLTLTPSSADAFADGAGWPRGAEPAAPRATESEATEPRPRPVVVIDPGHGGIDPGAEEGGMNEAQLMLAFAKKLEDALLRSLLFDVELTRRADEFVPLETRITRARQAGASVFLSLHADSLPEGAGEASGITVYTLSEDATDLASRRLAERHDKADLLAGTKVAEPGDEIALVLMDLARRDTHPRTLALAETLTRAFGDRGLKLAGRPQRSAAFSVLKAPDFPSVLIELGFLSSEADRERLRSPEWQDEAIAAIETALIDWALDDAARAELLRR